MSELERMEISVKIGPLIGLGGSCLSVIKKMNDYIEEFGDSCYISQNKYYFDEELIYEEEVGLFTAFYRRPETDGELMARRKRHKLGLAVVEIARRNVEEAEKVDFKRIFANFPDG